MRKKKRKKKRKRLLKPRDPFFELIKRHGVVKNKKREVSKNLARGKGRLKGYDE